MWDSSCLSNGFVFQQGYTGLDLEHGSHKDCGFPLLRQPFPAQESLFPLPRDLHGAIPTWVGKLQWGRKRGSAPFPSLRGAPFTEQARGNNFASIFLPNTAKRIHSPQCLLLKDHGFQPNISMALHHIVSVLIQCMLTRLIVRF